MSTQRKRNRFLNAKRQWEYRPEMKNENNPKVALTNERRETLAGTLDIFAERPCASDGNSGCATSKTSPTKSATSSKARTRPSGGRASTG
jgi:hypothetical protein